MSSSEQSTSSTSPSGSSSASSSVSPSLLKNMLPEATRHLVRIAAAVTASSPGVVRRVMAEAKDVVEPAQAEETLLQSYLFAGFPRMLNAFALWREVTGHAAPVSDPSLEPVTAEVVQQQGEDTCAIVYGKAYETLRGNIAALHPAIDQWMITEAYGKVLSRPGADLVTRELCIVAACAVGEYLPQLRSHLRGAQNCGATIDTLTATVSALTDLLPRDALQTAREEVSKLAAQNGAAQNGSTQNGSAQNSAGAEED